MLPRFSRRFTPAGQPLVQEARGRYTLEREQVKVGEVSDASSGTASRAAKADPRGPRGADRSPAPVAAQPGRRVLERASANDMGAAAGGVRRGIRRPLRPRSRRAPRACRSRAGPPPTRPRCRPCRADPAASLRRGRSPRAPGREAIGRVGAVVGQAAVVGQVRVVDVAPGELAAGDAARRVLPLRLGRQTAPCPRAVARGIGIAHVGHGELRARRTADRPPAPPGAHTPADTQRS